MKDFKIYIFIASILVTIYLVAQYKRPKPIDWTSSFLKTDKIPFGTYILYNQLHDIFPGAAIQNYREPVYNVLSDHDIKQATYLIISNSVNLTEYDLNKLTAFVKQGNDVFIAAADFGDAVQKKLKVETDRNYDLSQTDDSIRFVNKALNPQHFFKLSKELRENYFSAFDTTKAVVLARNASGKSTFIRFAIGKGALYLNTNPHLFTNYSLLNPDDEDYAGKALSYLKNSKTLLWDEYYVLGREGETSLMRVFFQKPPLKWAYCITLASLVLYVLYQLKRRQRIIPVIEPLRNSSIDFVKTVGQVYYERRNNANIAQKKATYFLEYIRTNYHLKTGLLNEELTATLSQKSGVDVSFLHRLFNQINIIRSGANISDRDLIAFNQNIEQFYIQSR
ncbi:DUF4350 domain-containing protein [Mucilaginibacter sp. AW1-3]